jgi:hypothetical protein
MAEGMMILATPMDGLGTTIPPVVVDRLITAVRSSWFHLALNTIVVNARFTGDPARVTVATNVWSSPRIIARLLNE